MRGFKCAGPASSSTHECSSSSPFRRVQSNYPLNVRRNFGLSLISADHLLTTSGVCGDYKEPSQAVEFNQEAVMPSTINFAVRAFNHLLFRQHTKPPLRLGCN